jgi:CDP-diacylglycerol--serine O-phosphatidyltransferase
MTFDPKHPVFSIRDAARRRGIYLLPNLFTTAALFGGFYAVVAAMDGKFEQSAIAIFVAMVLDGMDGRIARLTNTESDFGMVYDSLSDMVSPPRQRSSYRGAGPLQNTADLGQDRLAGRVAVGAALRSRASMHASPSRTSAFRRVASPSAAGVEWPRVARHGAGAHGSLVPCSLRRHSAAGTLMVSSFKYYSQREHRRTSRSYISSPFPVHPHAANPRACCSCLRPTRRQWRAISSPAVRATSARTHAREAAPARKVERCPTGAPISPRWASTWRMRTSAQASADAVEESMPQPVVDSPERTRARATPAPTRAEASPRTIARSASTLADATVASARGDTHMDWDALAAGRARPCPLYAGRTDRVGVATRGRLAFIGEAPGAEEDRQGERRRRSFSIRCCSRSA